MLTVLVGEHSGEAGRVAGGDVAQSMGTGNEWQLSVVAGKHFCCAGQDARPKESISTIELTIRRSRSRGGGSSQSGLGPRAQAVRHQRPAANAAAGRRPALALCCGFIGVSGLKTPPQQRHAAQLPSSLLAGRVGARRASKQRARRCVGADAPGWGWHRCVACSSRRSGVLQQEGVGGWG